jgi:hypothetical protein
VALPIGLAVDRDDRTLIGSAARRIQAFSPTGRLLANWERGLAAAGLRTPSAIVVDRAGDVYVADRDGHRVMAFRVLSPVTE